MKKLTLSIIALFAISTSSYAGLSGKVIAGKVIEGIGTICEAYDIFDAHDFVTQKVVHYTDIRFGYRIMTQTKDVRVKDPKTGKSIWKRLYIKLRVPHIVLYNKAENKHYWVNLTTNRAYKQGDNLMMPFPTLGWMQLSQNDANKFFTAEVMQQLASAHGI